MYVMKVFERGRRILRTVLRGMSISVASLILQACYGIMPPDDSYAEYGMPAPAYGMPPPYVEEVSIYGKVVAKETGKPIFGIQVSVEETEYWERTDKYGYFNFWIPVKEIYQLKFEDVDGPYNDGLFKTQTWKLTQDDTYKTLLIGMDEDTETETEIEADEE
jgi:hypothetical protein